MRNATLRLRKQEERAPPALTLQDESVPTRRQQVTTVFCRSLARRSASAVGVPGACRLQCRKARLLAVIGGGFFLTLAAILVAGVRDTAAPVTVAHRA